MASIDTKRTNLLTSPRSRRNLLGVRHAREVMFELFGEDLHAKRVESLANGVVGVLNATRVAVHAIGRAYAEVARISPKSGIKQVDRLLSNDGIQLDAALATWVRFVAGDTTELSIAMDWTDFEPDDHTTLAAYLVTTNGRAMPLAWKTLQKSRLKDHQTATECHLIERLHKWLPKGIRVTLLADRGFGKVELYGLLDLLGWDYVIRFREAITVTNAADETRPAREWLPDSGRATMLKNVRVTGKKREVPAVVVVKQKDMAEAWCLATSLRDESASNIVKRYGRRFTIEETFRDTKDLHFGLGLSATHIKNADRRDRMLLLIAIAHALLTLIGVASERSGLDRTLKANTVARRTMSLFNQGHYWYRTLPNMRDDYFARLIAAYEAVLLEHEFFCEIFMRQTPEN